MTTNSACEPWCDEHNDAAGDCLTLWRLYPHSSETGVPSDNPEFATVAAQFRALDGFPDQVDTIFIEVSYIPEEEDRPELVLRFRDVSKDADSATLSTTTAGLSELHTSLGEFLRQLE